MKILSQILAPETLETFRRNNWCRRAVHIKGTDKKFASLFGWDSLNRILNCYNPPHPALKLTKHGKPVSGKDAIEIIRQTQKGATLILENVDRLDPVLGRFLDELGDEISERVRINMYLSYPDERGYLLHYDTQDFFILQISGFKKWKVYPSTISSPLFFQKTHGTEPPPKESLYLDCTLGPGDILYCPRGHWHEPVADQKPSLHLTLGIFVATGIDYLSWLVDELRQDEVFRQNFPLLLKDERDSPTGRFEVNKQLELLKCCLLKKLENGSLDREFYRYRVASQRNRNPFNFPQHFSKDPSEFESINNFQRFPHATHLEVCANEVVLVFSGRQIAFDLSAEPLLKFLLNEIYFNKTDLLQIAPKLSWEQILKILHPLIREGLIKPKTTSD